jgi:fimbrial chaperone protein
MFPEIGSAADFSVNPVNVFFDAAQKATILTVKNQSEDKLTLQLTAYAWSQDDEGNDVYTPSDDVIIFPKILSFEGADERIIRIGINAPPGRTEKTFRVYLEEIPGEWKSPTRGTELRTIMKVGVPVFFEPVTSVVKGTIAHAAFSKGTLSFFVENSGNIHFIIKSIHIHGLNKAGESLFKTELGGWYLLEGRSRKFTTSIQENICSTLDYVIVDVFTDRLALKERLEVSPAQCSP